MQLISSACVYDGGKGPRHRQSCVFTDVYVTQSGTILVSGRWGSARDSVDGHVCLFASDDMGAHWELRYDGSGRSELAGTVGEIRTMSLTELAPGELTASFLWVDRSDPELPFIHETTQGLLPMRILHATSYDEGRTWSPFRVMETAPHVAASPCTCAVFRLPDGALCQPYEHWKEYLDPTPGHPGARLRLSRDEGKSWPEYLTVAWDEENLIAFWDQRIEKHPTSGQLVAMFWTHDFARAVDIDAHISWGSDDGRQWSAPQSTGLPGQHCQPLAVGGDALLAVYPHRRDPPGIALSISPDFGRTWDRSLDLKVYDSSLGTESGAEGGRTQQELWSDMELWRFGHPRASILPNGEIFVVFYAGDDTVKNACWARVRL
jgi:hypothetical protein